MQAPLTKWRILSNFPSTHAHIPRSNISSLNLSDTVGVFVLMCGMSKDVHFGSNQEFTENQMQKEIELKPDFNTTFGLRDLEMRDLKG